MRAVKIPQVLRTSLAVTDNVAFRLRHSFVVLICAAKQGEKVEVYIYVGPDFLTNDVRDFVASSRDIIARFLSYALILTCDS